jgi:hypothetical protein
MSVGVYPILATPLNCFTRTAFLASSSFQGIWGDVLWVWFRFGLGCFRPPEQLRRAFLLFSQSLTVGLVGDKVNQSTTLADSLGVKIRRHPFIRPEG